MRARLIAAAVAMLIAVFWGAPQSVEYLCAMNPEPASKCCCPHDEDDHNPELAQQATMERPPCCVASSDDWPISPTNLESSSLDAPLVAMASPCADLLPPARARAQVDGLGLARGPPPPRGPPLYQLNCSFVI